MVVVDIETSGLNPETYSILSIGAVDFQNPERQFYGECKMWEGALLAHESLAVNGFTEEQIQDPEKKTVDELMVEFKVWLDAITEVTLVGHNVAFDRDFMNIAFRRAGINWRFASRTIDTHTLGYADYIKKGLTLPEKNRHTDITLDTILKHVGLPTEAKPHNALSGAKGEAEATSRLLYGTNLLNEFERYPVPEHLLVKK